MHPSSYRSLWLLLLAAIGIASSQVTLMGGKGQLRLFDAENSLPGQLYLNGVYSLFLEKHDHVSIAANGAKEISSVLVKDNAFNLSMTLGISKTLEIFIHTVPYQDNQKDLWGPIGDTQCGLKLHLAKEGALLQTGVAGYIGLPTAPRHTIPFEPFAKDAYSWSLVGLMNLDIRNTRTAIPLKCTFNIGYRDNDWHDRYFVDEIDQLLAGAGFKFSLRAYQFYSEVTSEVFINKSGMTLRQNSIRYSQGVRFIGLQNFIFDIAADLKIGGYRPTAEQIQENPLLKRYADWKILLGASYRLTFFTQLTPEEKKAKALQAEEKRKMDEIRKKREKVAEEMEELKKNVDKEKQEKQPF